MTQEAYVSFEIAKLLKEKGFDESIHTWYNIDDGIPTFTEGYIKISNVDFVANDEDCYSAPTHQMACAWLREKHHIYVNPIRQGNYDDYSDYYTWIVASNGIIHRNQSVADKLSYEEAVEAALKYSLENLI